MYIIKRSRDDTSKEDITVKESRGQPIMAHFNKLS